MMSVINYFKTIVILVVLIVTCLNFAPAQTVNFPQPREEKLLNGLKLLVWNEPKSEKVTVKLRIHSGAAFDPKDKMGTMALLADILFPNEQAKAYFTEELEGSLDVASNHDYIQITAAGKADEIQAILETLATAVTNPQITPENFLLVRNARIEKIKALEKNPAYVVDRAIAKRLFGDFPYGRSAEGTLESLAKIDKADLMLANDRFFTADNATIAVVGNVKSDFVYRATRQLFGAWKKSESKIPATFRQPDAPTEEQLTVEMPNLDKPFSKSALNAAARNNKDFFPTRIFTKMFEKQACLNDGAIRYEAHLLRGVFSFGGNNAETTTENSPNRPCGFILTTSANSNGNGLTMPLQGEFDNIKAKVVNGFSQSLSSNSELAELWLDVDTFKLVSVKDEISKLNNVTFADVQRVAENLRKQPMVTVSLKSPKTAKQ